MTVPDSRSYRRPNQNSETRRTFRVHTSRHKKLARRKRQIDRRLRPRTWKAQATPMYRARNIQYEHSDRVRGLASGGIGAMHRLAQHTGLVDAIDRHLEVLKVALPYHESDHVLGIAYNVLCGGTCLQDIELDRKSTRLNSSHTVISYAVFCLKKKTSAAGRVADGAVRKRELTR